MTPEEARELLEGFLTEEPKNLEEERRVAIELHAAMLYAKPQTEEQRAWAQRYAEIHERLMQEQATPEELQEAQAIKQHIREAAQALVDQNIEEHGSAWGKLPANA